MTRLFDMIGKRHLRCDDLFTFMLDRASEGLSREFKDQFYDSFKTMPPDIQASLLSATMAPEILDLTSKFMRDALRILVMRMVDVGRYPPGLRGHPKRGVEA